MWAISFHIYIYIYTSSLGVRWFRSYPLQKIWFTPPHTSSLGLQKRVSLEVSKPSVNVQRGLQKGHRFQRPPVFGVTFPGVLTILTHHVHTSCSYAIMPAIASTAAINTFATMAPSWGSLVIWSCCFVFFAPSSNRTVARAWRVILK